MFHVGLRCANPTYESVDPYPAMGYNLYQFVVSAPIFALSDHKFFCPGARASRPLENLWACGRGDPMQALPTDSAGSR